ncbi:MAG: LytR/AlgR family response regulator transcription factor [Vicinamibacterales bacterium]
MTTRVLLVDDEAVARRRMRRYLASESTITIVGECADGRSAVTAIRTLRPDVVLLDVQMPELDGFAVLYELSPSEWPAVIFVTAFDRYALRAFDLHAIDYLLKPFTRDRFALALARAKARLRDRESDDKLLALAEQLRAAPRAPSRVAVRSRNRIVVIDWADVDWIEAADNYVKLHVGRVEYLLRNTLAALEKQLDSHQFVRVHRSSMVRIDRITELVPETHGDFTLRLRDGSAIALSRTFRERAERALGWDR